MYTEQELEDKVQSYVEALHKEEIAFEEGLVKSITSEGKDEEISYEDIQSTFFLYKLAEIRVAIDGIADQIIKLKKVVNGKTR